MTAWSIASKVGLRKWPQNAFKTKINRISCFLCILLGMKCLTRVFPLIYCVWSSFISDVPIVQKLVKTIIRFGQNFPGRMESRAVCLCEEFQAVCLDAVFFSDNWGVRESFHPGRRWSVSQLRFYVSNQLNFCSFYKEAVLWLRWCLRFLVWELEIVLHHYCLCSL